MKASLQLRLSQHLALTPQLQQSIRLLQLSTLELQQEVATALAQNPLLENDEDWLANPARVAADGSLIGPGAAAPSDRGTEPTSIGSTTHSSGERGDQREPNG